MEIKQKEQEKSFLNMFDIADSSGKETGLSKILAYIMATDERALYAFLKILHTQESIDGFRGKKNDTEQLLKNAKINIEVAYTKEQLKSAKAAGRTDIEIITQNPNMFIIVECKVNQNKATIEQFNLYKPIYEHQNKQGYQKYFVYLTHFADTNILEDITSEDIRIIDITWQDVINAFNAVIEPDEKTELQDFIDYYERRYSMTKQKEILIQDLRHDTTIQQFHNSIYRRSAPKNKAGDSDPLYFAPYFTQSSSETEGINYIAKILGTITGEITWDKVEGKCKKFLQNHYPDNKDEQNKLLENWKKGVEAEEGNNEFKWYLLDKPIKLAHPLLKTSESGSFWLNSQITGYLRVYLSDFIAHSILSTDYNKKEKIDIIKK